MLLEFSFLEEDNTSFIFIYLFSMTMNEKGIDTTLMLEYFLKYDMLIFL